MMSATYSVEDNKLRLYAGGRLGDETYQRVKEAGFRWAPKQELFVAPAWTPRREDLLLELCGEIDDEDYSAEERSADRAERFAGYRDKRRAEATDRADAFDARPGAFGHQNRERAERQAARHDRHRTAAVSQWAKAEYWQARTKAVIGHALYKSSAKVRRSRILAIEADQRKHEKCRTTHREQWEAWRRISEMPGADELIPMADQYSADWSQANEAQRLAYQLANGGEFRVALRHPDSEEANAKAREIHGAYWSGFSAYDLLTRDEYVGAPLRRLTPKEYGALFLSKAIDPDVYGRRWSDHYENRLAYERAMLAAEGGTAGDADMIPGGWIRAGGASRFLRLVSVDGWAQIIKVNRSPATKRVTSVVVRGSDPYGYSDPAKANAVRELVVNVERLPEGAYREPTAEELAEFNAAKKAAKKPTVSTINPTDEDAQRLQDRLNKSSKNPSEVCRVTQAKFSEWLKHGYSRIAEYTIGGSTFKVRVNREGWCSAYRVIVLTDKPQKPLPVDWTADEAPAPLTMAQG